MSVDRNSPAIAHSHIAHIPNIMYSKANLGSIILIISSLPMRPGEYELVPHLRFDLDPETGEGGTYNVKPPQYPPTLPSLPLELIGQDNGKDIFTDQSGFVWTLVDALRARRS